MASSGGAVSVDVALVAINEWGLGQRLQLLTVGGAWTLCALHTFLCVWGGLDPVRSHQVKCVGMGNSSVCSEALKAPYPQLCSLPRDSWQWTDPGVSLVSDFDLICGRNWLLFFSVAIFFLGTIAGAGAWQLANERTSRRRLLYTGCVLAGVAGASACTAPTFWTFLLFRAAGGAAVALMGAAALVLACDVAGPSWRTTQGALLQHFFSAGGCLATLLAWAVPSWRWQTCLVALATLAYVATWSSGEATAAIAALAFANRRRPPQEPLADPVGLLSNPHRAMRDVVSNAYTRRRLLLLALPWFAMTASYYGGAMLFGAISSGLTGDDSIYVTALISFAYELPGIAAASLAAERAGRKPTLMVASLLGGTSLVVGAVVRGTPQRALAVASRIAIAAASGALLLLTAELFPAAVAHHGLALANYCGRLGAVVAPGLAYVQARLRSPFVPMLVFGSLCCGAAVASALLPETLGSPVHETIQDLATAVQLGGRRRSWAVSLQALWRREAPPGRQLSGSQPSLAARSA
eukprot:scaffold22.g6041.t1